MSADLYFKDGVCQMFTVGDKSWHEKEQNLDRALSYEDALGERYGLQFPMEKLPYYRPQTDEEKKKGFMPAPEAFYIQRMDTKAILGKVSESYEIVPMEIACRPLKPLVDEGFATIETGGVLREGADCWMLLRWDLTKFGDAAKEVFQDEVIPYSAVLANHSGRRSILLGNTPIRVVCANTLGAAESNRQSRWASIPHIAGAEEKLIEAAQEMFGNVIQRYEVLAKHYKLLMQTKLDKASFEELVLDAVAPDPWMDPAFNPEAKLAASVLDRAERKRKSISELWMTGKGHTGEPTAWFAYNAAVEAIDHGKDLWPRRDGSWQSRGLLGSKWSEMKGRVLDNLIQYALAV